MKIALLSLVFAAAALISCTAAEPEEDIDVHVSSKCAASLLASTTTVGAGMAYTFAPAAICAIAGFCPGGVAVGGFAAWWQSTGTAVVAGSLFAQLQSLAMAGAGVSSVVAGAAIGGAVGAGYLRDFCAYVDDTDPESAMGIIFTTSVSVVTATIEMKEKVRNDCASSETCTAVSEAGAATVETILSKWSSFKKRVSNDVKRAANRA